MEVDKSGSHRPTGQRELALPPVPPTDSQSRDAGTSRAGRSARKALGTEAGKRRALWPSPGKASVLRNY